MYFPSSFSIGTSRLSANLFTQNSSVPKPQVDSLAPNDPRVEHKFTEVGGFKYHYMLAKPAGKPTATVFLIHGWPDLGMGWRYQVPFLVSLNLQVVVPDMLGYGQTDAPDSYEEYRMTKMTAHMVEIVKQVTDQPIILGGHDWGGLFVWRMAQYYPSLVRCVFSVCVPYVPPSSVRMALPDLVAKMPNFTYQLQLASGKTEEIVAKSPERLRGFLNGVYGGTTPEGKPAITVSHGVLEENIDSIRQSPLVSKEMIDFYVQEFSRHGLHGPCNWYRTREINGADEEVLAKDSFKFPMPAMLLMADKDAALPPWMAVGQEKHFAGGLKLETITDCSHWAMVQHPDKVNKHIGDFVKGILGDDLKSAL
ncbi:Alpha/Beta hydrolase protein [Xylaria sp. FL1777]|nr:Alpha/Beta hydrolase protein [Xylaria sp. FL1777]